MRLDTEIKLDYKDVLIRPKRSTLRSRKQVSLMRSYTFRHSGKKWEGIPIMGANMDGVGTFGMHQALASHELFVCAVKHYDEEDWKQAAHIINPERIAISTGTGMDDWKKVQKIIVTHNLSWICIDIANGYSEHFVDFIKRVRERFPEITIIAGNVVTADMTQELILSGADIVKVGIGPGSVCTTRIQTGVGYPQLSSVIECADAAHGLNGHIIADGGCTCPGDVSKAFAGGADFVMLGGMLAGHTQGGGNVITRYFHNNGEMEQINGRFQPRITEKKFVQFYGMSSSEAMKKHHGGVANYRSSEGRVVEVPYRGDVDATVLDLLGGIRSTCTYVGASKLKYLGKCATLIRCTQQFNSVFVGR
jgi:GMP reductase